MRSTLHLYRQCANLRWPKSYLGKFLLIAFLGVHLPLITIILYMLSVSYDWSVAGPLVLVCLIATLVGTLTTLAVQRQLLEPMLLTARALEQYVRERRVPELPVDFQDDAGRLMHNTQLCITHLDKLLGLKNDLLAVISHDTRAPVANIVLASQLINQLLDEPTLDVSEIRELNTQIQQLARRQIDLMNNLLLLARAEAGAITVQQREVTLGQLLGSVTTTYRLQAEQKGIRLQTPPTVEADLIVCIDSTKTEQVLNNLVHNAIKFTPVGGTIMLDAQVHDQQLTLQVRDSGTGMEDAVRAQLFSPFTQERRYGTSGEPGSGLGLWICKTFTELQGGQISASSQQGQGTCFEIRLPLAYTPRLAQPLEVFA